MRTAIVYADKHTGQHRVEDMDARCRLWAAAHQLDVIETIYGHRYMDTVPQALAAMERKSADVLIVPMEACLRRHTVGEVVAVCALAVVDTKTVYERVGSPS